MQEQIITLISAARLPLNDEKRLQEALSELFNANHIPHKREVTLAPGKIVDFVFSGGLVMEVKLKASRRNIYRQCKKYCEEPAVNGLILASATAMGLPPEIEGKPIWAVSLGSGWL